MRRRALIAKIAGAAVWPLAARAQGNPVAARIGYVYVGPKELAASRVDLIVSGVRASGYRLPLETVVRLTEGDPGKLEPMIADILDNRISVFVAAGPAALLTAKQATSTVPIVAYDFESDPVAEKYAYSIARPGGNVTGIFLDQPGFAGKWIEFLRDCMPQLSHVALMWDPGTGRLQADSVNAIATQLGIRTDLLEVHARADYAGAFAIAKDRGAGAVLLLSSPLVFANAKELAELSLHHLMPTITMFAEFARAGGLLAYGPSVLGATRQAGFMSGKVMAGASPANLPIERPATFELVVNRRAAEMLRVTIPASLQARAEEVIE